MTYQRKSVNQQLFDKVVKHLWEQNERATSGYGCSYRGLNNTSCAVGCLISDCNYDPNYEGRRAWDTSVLHSVKRSIRRALESNTAAMLNTLQTIHDYEYSDINGYRTPDVHKKFAELAAHYNLNTKVLDRVYKSVLTA